MFSCGVAGDLYLLVVLLKIHVFLWCCWRFVSIGGVAEDSCFLVMLLEIRIYLSTSGVAGDSCFLVVLLEIRFYWWGFWRFVFSCGVAGDSCLPTAFLEIHVSWDATPCWLVNSYRLSEWSQCLHLQGQQSGCNIPNNLQRHSLFNRTALLLWKTCNIHHNWFAVTTKYVHVYTQSHYMVSRYLICISYWD